MGVEVARADGAYQGRETHTSRPALGALGAMQGKDTIVSRYTPDYLLSQSTDFAKGALTPCGVGAVMRIENWPVHHEWGARVRRIFRVLRFNPCSEPPANVHV